MIGNFKIRNVCARFKDNIWAANLDEMGSLFSLNRGVKYLLFIIDANEILMYSTHNEGKSVAAKRFIKTLKSKIYKRLTATSKKPGLSYLNKLVDEYNNT